MLLHWQQDAERTLDLYKAGTPMLSMIQDALLFRRNLNVHLLEILGDLERCLGLRLDLINSDALGVFPQC